MSYVEKLQIDFKQSMKRAREAALAKKAVTEEERVKIAWAERAGAEEREERERPAREAEQRRAERERRLREKERELMEAEDEEAAWEAEQAAWQAEQEAAKAEEEKAAELEALRERGRRLQAMYSIPDRRRQPGDVVTGEEWPPTDLSAYDVDDFVWDSEGCRLIGIIDRVGRR